MLRTLNIATRTVHICCAGVLLGGHAFGVPKAALFGWLLGTVLSGVVLVGLESGGRLLWLHQGRGILTVVKLGLIALVPLFWKVRFFLLLAATVLACVGSHMPARFRYYSVLLRQVIPDRSGPGAARLLNEGEAVDCDPPDRHR